jgi:hypothetical protein
MNSRPHFQKRHSDLSLLALAMLAAYADQPIFWLLVLPVAVFLRQRLRRREGSIDF